MSSINQAPPANDELELSVFGPGYGEAICLHMGDGEWALVDSFINADTNRPQGLAYLQSIGVDPGSSVRLVVITHWDDDHLQGMGEVVQASPTATVVCSTALCRQDIFAFVLQQGEETAKAGSGLDEFRSVLRTCNAPGNQNHLKWAKATLPLHPTPPVETPTVVALSPSDNAFERSLQSLIEAATASKSAIARRYKAPEGPNGASVATFIRREGIGILLGADLESTDNQETGWADVLAHARPPIRSSAVKTPHHGSKGAHHDGMWNELVEHEAIAIVAPWARGSGFLPTEADLRRLKKFAGQLYLTAVPAFRRASKDTELRRLLRRVHPEGTETLRGWGHVRLRRRLGEASWRVDLDGDAKLVN